MVVLTGIEVKVRYVVASASPNNRYTKPHGKPCLKVDAASLTCKVRYQQTTFANLRNDTVINLLVVLAHVDAESTITCGLKSGLETFRENFVQIFVEPHSYESLTRIALHESELFDTFPAFKC